MYSLSHSVLVAGEMSLWECGTCCPNRRQEQRKWAVFLLCSETGAQWLIPRRGALAYVKTCVQSALDAVTQLWGKPLSATSLRWNTAPLRQGHSTLGWNASETELYPNQKKQKSQPSNFCELPEFCPSDLEFELQWLSLPRGNSLNSEEHSCRGFKCFKCINS